MTASHTITARPDDTGRTGSYERRSGLVRVWDPLVRVFHWTLVTAFFVAYFTEDELLTPHVYAGYLIAGLIVFRLIWGVIGTRHARFSDFVRRPREVLDYLRSIRTGHPRRYLGHNPAGGAMIIALLSSLVLTTVTGIAIYGAGESAGPLAASLAGTSEFWTDVLEEFHEFMANLTVLLVALHVTGVIIASRQHKENLVRAMIDGRKQALSDDGQA